MGFELIPSPEHCLPSSEASCCLPRVVTWLPAFRALVYLYPEACVAPAFSQHGMYVCLTCVCTCVIMRVHACTQEWVCQLQNCFTIWCQQMQSGWTSIYSCTPHPRRLYVLLWARRSQHLPTGPRPSHFPVSSQVVQELL